LGYAEELNIFNLYSTILHHVLL